jgi:hypothetical protein
LGDNHRHSKNEKNWKRCLQNIKIHNNTKEMNTKVSVTRCIYKGDKLILFKSHYFIEKQLEAVAWIL